MEMPNLPPDPKGYKDVTDECQSLFDELLSRAEELFGRRTQFGPVRITEDDGRRTCFNDNGIAYIRLGKGVGPRVNPTADEARQLKHSWHWRSYMCSRCSVALR
jgi:hypothetical protein